MANDVLYHEVFGDGPGAWVMGKDLEQGSWHRNIFGHHGEPVPLGWEAQREGRGGYAYSESPWYFDDNHGEFMWLHLAFFVNRSEDIGLAGQDLREAVITLTLRGTDLALKGTELYFWIQGWGSADPSKAGRAMRNWALSSEPIVDELLDGDWHERSICLTNDEDRWSFMGLLNGGLARRLLIHQSLSSGQGSLDAILGSTHVNLGFLLCGVDPVDPPTGRLDIDEICIRAAGQ